MKTCAHCGQNIKRGSGGLLVDLRTEDWWCRANPSNGGDAAPHEESEDGFFNYKHTHESVEDGSPAMLVRQDDTTITLINEDGTTWTDPLSQWRAISTTWPTTDEERTSFADWQYEVSNGDTTLGFREWLAHTD